MGSFFIFQHSADISGQNRTFPDIQDVVTEVTTPVHLLVSVPPCLFHLVTPSPCHLVTFYPEHVEGVILPVGSFSHFQSACVTFHDIKRQIATSSRVWFSKSIHDEIARI
jgi:hypothetical protein